MPPSNLLQYLSIFVEVRPLLNRLPGRALMGARSFDRALTHAPLSLSFADPRSSTMATPSAFVRAFESMPRGQAIVAGLGLSFVLTQISNTMLCGGGEKVRALLLLMMIRMAGAPVCYLLLPTTPPFLCPAPLQPAHFSSLFCCSSSSAEDPREGLGGRHRELRPRAEPQPDHRIFGRWQGNRRRSSASVEIEHVLT